MIYLAWKTATAADAGSASVSAKPLGFVAAAGYQWINPKSSILMLTVAASYTSPKSGWRSGPSTERRLRDRGVGELLDLSPGRPDDAPVPHLPATA